ncbi:MAG TPA: magnesium/cobalt transporter CorA [Methylococcaceae bacterium]|nr:magnesium/cobalt transporter CorA [Methylococcaceae bacterium]
MAYFTKRYHPPGTTPGTLTGGAAPAPEAPRLSFIRYDVATLEEKTPAVLDDCGAEGGVRWLHLQGAADPATLQALHSRFGLHHLALEDVLNTGQHPKADPYEDQLFVILSHPRLEDGKVQTEQVSLFLLENLVVSLHSGSSDPFEPVRKRLRAGNGGLRRRGADDLLHALIDLVVDEGFPLLETLGDDLEALEDALLDKPTRDTLNAIHRLKRELLLLRRLLWPHREVLNTLQRGDSPLIDPGTRPYLRDCQDHAVHIMELLEVYRDMTSNMLDVYLSSLSNRLNENMRILTVIATLFMPLTFIAGVYGMNFDRNVSPWNMPELGWAFGYPAVWGVMLAVALGMVMYFRRKKWL